MRAPDLNRVGVGSEAELVVAGEDRHPDLLGVKGKALGRELPAEGNRVLLEVVTKAEVAEHLEVGQVTGCGADLLDIGRAKAALA